MSKTTLPALKLPVRCVLACARSRSLRRMVLGAACALVFSGCEKKKPAEETRAPSPDISQQQPSSPMDSAVLSELFSAQLVAQVLDLDEEQVQPLSGLEQGAGYQWPLPNQAEIEQLNSQMMLAGLKESEPAPLLPTEGRTSLSLRTEAMSLDALETVFTEGRQETLDRMPKRVELSEQGSAEQGKQGAHVALWCPVGRVLYFSHAVTHVPTHVEVHFSLAMAHGGTHQQDERLAVALARRVLARLDEPKFWNKALQQDDAQEESWIQPEKAEVP